MNQHIDLNTYWFLKMHISGWIAQFRDPYTITSKLTLELPSKTNLIGILLAKVGITKTEYIPNEELRDLYRYYMQNTFFAVAFMNKKITKYIDYLNYRSKEKQSKKSKPTIGIKPTNVEYLIFPAYEIICFLPKIDKYGIFSEDKKNNIIGKEFFKTYLGSNECPATIETEQEIEVKEEKTNFFDSRYLLLTKEMEKEEIEPMETKDKFFYSLILKSSPLEEKHEREIVLVPKGEKVKFKSKKQISVYYFENDGKKEYFKVF